MSKKILLVCAGGFSTSMLVEKMKEAAIKEKRDFFIEACGENSVKDHLPTNVIMIGPQMGHMEEEIREIAGGDIPVTTIDMMDYGMMDGEKVLHNAIKLMNI